mmetsp:Transcript_28784/g.60270  ORF Transcript_28784/g.60270 Transcript_28784/m.60270 type:complete len:331 (+) Transcript_28784:1426-2418(+)
MYCKCQAWKKVADPRVCCCGSGMSNGLWFGDGNARLRGTLEKAIQGEFFGCRWYDSENYGLGILTALDAQVLINANLKAETVEELRGRKKTIHLSSFNYLLGELKHELESLAIRYNAQHIIKSPGQSRGFTVHGFLKRITEEAEEFLRRHEELGAEEYTKDEVFRALTTEMLEVKNMAISKLLSWICDSTQDISWFQSVPLRMAHRGRISYLTRTLPSGAESQQAAVELCKVMGILQHSVEEANELGESKLFSSAAEGASTLTLKLLVTAGAHVNSVNNYGETALIQAGRFGHSDCIRNLLDYKANINASTTDVSTVSIIPIIILSLSCT